MTGGCVPLFGASWTNTGQNQERLIQIPRRSFAQKHSAAFLLKRRLTMKEIKRGEIYAADFGAGFGSEQGGVRPVLILQNNTGNKYSPTTIVAAITGRKSKNSSAYPCDSYGKRSQNRDPPSCSSKSEP